VDALLLPRRALQDRVLAQRRVLVTAPPGAGKTALIQLLEQRLTDRRVLSLSTLTARADIRRADLALSHGEGTTLPLSSEEASNWWLAVHRLSEVPDARSIDLAMTYYDYIIIDDAQLLYSAPLLWTSIIKHKGAASVMFFASTAMESVMSNTPAVPHKVRQPQRHGMGCTRHASGRAICYAHTTS